MSGIKVKVVPYSINECWARSWFRSLGSQPTGDLVVKLAVGCHYTFRLARSYLPSPRASVPLGPYQIILLGDRGRPVKVACPRPLRGDALPGLEPASCESQVRCPFSIAWLNHMVCNASPHLWNKLPVSLPQPCLNQSSSPSSSSLSPLSSSITPSLFHSKLKHIFSKNLFLHRHPRPSTGLISRISGCFCFLLLNGFLFSSHFIHFLVYGAVR